MKPEWLEIDGRLVDFSIQAEVERINKWSIPRKILEKRVPGLREYRRKIKRARRAGYRQRAHDAFDRLWQSGYMSRDEAYAWLKTHHSKRHIRQMRPHECNRLVKLVHQHFPHLTNLPPMLDASPRCPTTF